MSSAVYMAVRMRMHLRLADTKADTKHNGPHGGDIYNSHIYNIIWGQWMSIYLKLVDHNIVSDQLIGPDHIIRFSASFR